MKEWLFFVFTRVAYFCWMVLCIGASAGFSISLLAYQNVLGLLLSCMLAVSLPLLYQYGLDHLDFENASNMFEFEWNDEGEDDE